MTDGPAERLTALNRLTDEMATNMLKTGMVGMIPLTEEELTCLLEVIMRETALHGEDDIVPDAQTIATAKIAAGIEAFRRSRKEKTDDA